MATWDFRDLSATAAQARQAAKSDDPKVLAGAVVILLRETRANILALELIRARGGVAGEMAGAALDSLRR